MMWCKEGLHPHTLESKIPTRGFLTRLFGEPYSAELILFLAYNGNLTFNLITFE